MFDNEIYNALSGNFTVKQIIQMVKIHKKDIKIEFVKTKIMNQLSYHVDDKKLKKLGLNLNNKIENDIRETLRLFRQISY